MKHRTIPKIKNLFGAIVIYLCTSGLYAYTFDWNTQGWDDEDLSNSYTDVDGSGIDISINITGDTNRFGDNSPRLDDDDGNLNNDNLKLYVNYKNKTQSVTETIKFSVPVRLSNLRWRDIDYSNNRFDDKVIVSAKDADGNTVYASYESPGSAIESHAQGEYESDDTQNYTPEDSEAMVTLGFDTYVKELTFTYTDGDSAPNNPKGQAIWFDDFDFQPKDTDGDGVPDFQDIDDDGDGILDAVEIQGGGTCPYGFFHVISGQLNVFDAENSVYLPIGPGHDSINGMGFDEQSGKLYAVIMEDSSDDDGTTLAEGDVIEIDRYTGKIKKASSKNLKSNSGDFYNGVLYERIRNKKIKKWNEATDTTTILTLDASFPPVDFSISDASGTPMGYGLKTTNTNTGKTKIYTVNLSTGAVTTKTITVTTPDGGTLSQGWGATFMADDNQSGQRKMYAANNAGYIYEIVGFDTNSPSAQFVYRSVETNNNDGASCKDANQYAADTDGDGIPDYLDLDSDNDGIPDNVEAQSTGNYTAPSGNDSDGDGLDDAYDPDDGGTSVPLPDTDHDGTLDFLDSDSDNDGYSDCEEGLLEVNGTTKTCPPTSIRPNGFPDWATDTDDYDDVNGYTDNPQTDLFNETGNTDEVGYREFLCGKTEYKLTAYQWRLISLPCDAGNVDIQTLFGNTLGTYGNSGNWVVYGQSGSDNYEVNASAGSNHKNTAKVQLAATDKMQVGKSYWIIADADHNITIDKTIDGLAPTSTQDADASAFGIQDPDFLKVHGHSLPDNLMNHSGWVKKYMAGNPFPYSFNMDNLYFSHGGGGNYHPMGDTANDPYISSVVYTHDSSDLTDQNVTAGGGYQPIDPATPGLGGSLIPMEGFFVKILENSDQGSNSFAYPLTYGNDK